MDKIRTKAIDAIKELKRIVIKDIILLIRDMKTLHFQLQNNLTLINLCKAVTRGKDESNRGGNEM